MKYLKGGVNKLRYVLLGKVIMKNMEKAERAGRETAEHEYGKKLNEMRDDIYAKVKKQYSDWNHGVNPDYIMTHSKNLDGSTKLIFLGGDQIAEQEANNLRSEVKFLRNSKVWAIITSTLKSQAQDIMFSKSQTFEDMRSGKMMLYNLGVQETILSTIEKTGK